MATGVTWINLGGLLVGLCVLAIILLVVLGLLTKWRAWRRAVGVVLLIMFGLPAVWLVYAMMTSLDRARQIAEARLPVAAATTSWSEAMDRTFAEADLHPTARSASRALAWWMADRLTEAFNKVCEPPQIRVGGAVPAELLDVMTETLGQEGLRLETVQCAESELSNVPPTCDAAVRLERVPHRMRTVSGHESGTLKVSATVVAAAGPYGQRPSRRRSSKAVEFSDKRWVDDFGAFASDEPDREWVVAYSSKVTDSRHDAHQQVLSAAANKLRPYLRDSLRGQSSRRAQEFAQYPGDLLRAQIEPFLRSGELIADRFVQSVRRPYGDVWREALLIDASPDKFALVGATCLAHLEAQGNHYQAKAGSERVWWMRTVLSIAGLIALICVMYLFLNFATKGYYVWALRGAAVVIAAAAALFALKFW